MLIGSRALQGIGAALVSPATLAIVNTTFPGGDDQRKALSLWAALSAGGAAVGLLLGGILTQALSWPWIFFVNVPIGVLAVALALRFVPGTRAARSSSAATDMPARSGSPAVSALLIYVIVKTQSYGWGSAKTLDLGAHRDRPDRGVRRASRRACARRSCGWQIFRVRALAGGDAALFFLAAGMFANFYFGTLYLQDDPALHSDRDRLRVPAGRRADRCRRRDQPADRAALRDPRGRDRRDDDRRRRAGADGAGRRPLDLCRDAAAVVRAARGRPRDSRSCRRR